MAEANREHILKECELKHFLPQIYESLLTASCLAYPSDPIQFLKNALWASQGHENLEDVDWREILVRLPNEEE